MYHYTPINAAKTYISHLLTLRSFKASVNSSLSQKRFFVFRHTKENNMNGVIQRIYVKDQINEDDNNTEEYLRYRDEVQPKDQDRTPITHHKNKGSLSLIIDSYTPDFSEQHDAVETTKPDGTRKTRHEDKATTYIKLVSYTPDLEETTSNQISSTPTVRFDSYTLDIEENATPRQKNKLRHTELVETPRTHRKYNVKFLPKRKINFDQGEECEEIVSLDIEENTSSRQENEVQLTNLVEIPRTHCKYDIKLTSKIRTDFNLSEDEEIVTNMNNSEDFLKAIRQTVLIIIIYLLFWLLVIFSINTKEYF